MPRALTSITTVMARRLAPQPPLDRRRGRLGGVHNEPTGRAPNDDTVGYPVPASCNCGAECPLPPAVWRYRTVELTPILGHLILDAVPEEGGPDGSSSEVSARVSA